MLLKEKEEQMELQISLVKKLRAINSLTKGRFIRTPAWIRPLWFDSLKRPPHVSHHQIFTFWVVTYWR